MLTPSYIIALEKAVSEQSLSEFIKLAWHVVEPSERYVHNWHIDAVSDHLMAVARGEITRLLINMPPGTMKSKATSVFFPAWLWGPAGLPHIRFIGASHEQSLATRDNRGTRLLIESEWFQTRWPVKIVSDQNEKTYFENEERGFRQSTPVKSMTGKRGHIVVWDDPINPEEANSPTARETAIRVFTETLPSRVVDPAKSGIIIVMQRLHEDDISGYILANDLGYVHLCLPMEFEPDRKCITPIGFEDPRTEPGELLFEDRFPRHVVERDKQIMGSYATAGQFQQRPAPRGGGLFRRSDFEIVDAVPVGCRWARGWDFAATESDTAAYTVGSLVGIAPDGTVFIADMVRERVSPAGLDRLLRNTATMDGTSIPGSIPQDPGSSGKYQAKALLKGPLMGFDYTASPETGAKEARAQPFAAQVGAGNVKLLRGPWNKAFLDEAELFPHGKFKDQIDATVRAFAKLTGSSDFTWYVGGNEKETA